MDKNLILECLVKNLDVDITELKTVSQDTSLIELGMTSIGFISFIVDIEKCFNIEILDSDLIFENFATLNMIFEVLSKYDISSEINVVKKVLVLDADNVIWKGVSGEEIIEIDEMVLLFQELLLQLYNQGVLLCLCSKNEISEIRKSFLHPKMLIDENNFALILANENDKVNNLRYISKQLNLSEDSFVFADDSDYELGYVKINIPEINCVKVDYSKFDFYKQIKNMFSMSKNYTDINRTELYKAQKEREKDKVNFVSIEDYNQSLNTELFCGVATLDQIDRLAELSNRTNKFNLSNRHYSTNELELLINQTGYKIMYISAKDKYGDMGIIGMAVVNKSIIESFMISCRVFGRNFEVELLNKIKEIISNELKGVYIQTEKNSSFANFYSKHNVPLIVLKQ